MTLADKKEENVKKFPNFGWHHKNVKEDCEFKMTVPEPEKVDKFAHTWVQNVNAYSVDKMAEILIMNCVFGQSH